MSTTTNAAMNRLRVARIALRAAPGSAETRRLALAALDVAGAEIERLDHLLIHLERDIRLTAKAAGAAREGAPWS
jgi:hypothetical protein